MDAETHSDELLDCLVVEDVGRIVNPLTLHGQAIGGMVQGLGGAFRAVSRPASTLMFCGSPSLSFSPPLPGRSLIGRGAVVRGLGEGGGEPGAG